MLDSSLTSAYLMSLANSCPALSAPANGAVSPISGTTGTVAAYSCNAGYYMEGSASTTCQADGVWSSSAPLCYGKEMQ